MNGNKKLIKNFPNCFQVSLIGNRQPSLFPAPKSGGFTRLGAGQEGPRNSSGQVLLELPELFQRRPRGLPLLLQPSPSTARSTPKREFGLWGGGLVGGDPPSPNQGRVVALPWKHPLAPGRPRGESQRPKSVSRSQTPAVGAVCAPPRETRSLEASS